MRRLPSRFRRLDGALADLPVEEPMLLTELDGYLTGLLLCPAPIAAEEWMTGIWGPEGDGIPPFDDPLDVQWFADAVAARRDEIARDLTRGKLQPILDTDERTGEVLWEDWVAGLADAVALRPDAWATLGEEAAEAASSLATLIAVAHEESDLDSLAINALSDRAPAMLGELTAALFAARVRLAGPPPVAAPPPAVSIGRNDPCPCGSGKKHKRCCG